MNYEDITFDMLGTHRQRPMYLSKFTKFRQELSMMSYPKDPHAYTRFFLEEIDAWIAAHTGVKYHNLDSFTRRDAILGTTHQLDELHLHHGKNIVTFEGEYKYHRRLTDYTVRQITGYEQIQPGDVLVLSYPSCITTGEYEFASDMFDHCLKIGVPVHIDGAWFGQCRNFSVDVSHPAIHSVSVSLSKALGLGSQRIGIRYTRAPILGPISIMNDYCYANVSDMWLGVESMKHFGPEFYWREYGLLYTKVCSDFGLEEANSIHVGWHQREDGKHQMGIRSPLRMLIEGIWDERGTNAGLNEIEKNERS